MYRHVSHSRSGRDRRCPPTLQRVTSSLGQIILKANLGSWPEGMRSSPTSNALSRSANTSGRVCQDISQRSWSRHGQQQNAAMIFLLGRNRRTVNYPAGSKMMGALLTRIESDLTGGPWASGSAVRICHSVQSTGWRMGKLRMISSVPGSALRRSQSLRYSSFEKARSAKSRLGCRTGH